MNSEVNCRPERAAESEAAFWCSLEELLPLFEREGIALNLEAHPDDFCEENTPAVDLVRAINKPWVNYLYCAPHSFHLSGASEVGADIAAMMRYAGDLGGTGQEVRPVLVVTCFFAFTSWMLVSAHGASRATAEAGKALESGDAASWVFAPIAAQFGAWTGDVLPILLATSLFAGILAFHNSANRYLFSLGREGLLPHGLTTLNRRHSPWAAGIVQTVIAVALVMPFALLGKDPVLTLFSWFSGVAVLGIMLLYFLASVSVVVFFRRSRADTRPWNTLVAPVLGALGIAGAIWLIIANFTTLIGGDETTAVRLQLTVPAVLVLGLVVARLTRRGQTVTS